jgi:EAL and modified HD-GYP domain-containing signal transduction protein
LKPSKEKVLLAKQAIYKKDHSAFGFELLFRDESNLSALEVGEDFATNQVLVNYWTSLSKDLSDKDTPIFINVSESFLLSEYFLPINHQFVVIELLETISVTKELITAIKAWKQKGFRFALDDFDFSDQWKPIIELTDFIKVDVLNMDLDRVEQLKSSLSDYKGTWLAEKIETAEIFERCKIMGFTLFQGYYLAKPKSILGNVIRPSSTIMTQIIQKASQDNTSIAEIATLVTRDPKLTVQLLKLINSSLFTLPRVIHDLKEAITFLGIDILKKWAMMIAFISDSSAPIEASRIVLTRARACELLIMQSGKKKQSDTAFLAGLLSGVDVLLELDPAVFIKEMKLSTEIQNAVLHEQGEIGVLIQLVKKLEYYLSQEPENIPTIDTSIIQQFALAQDWSNEIILMLKHN